jgi:pimeloyl-ACP methyl ester carboxylesterase
LLGRIHVPTLIADGTEDVFNPVANDRILACGIARSRLVLYPDAGHAFLFQEAVSFVPVVERFLGR